MGPAWLIETASRGQPLVAGAAGAIVFVAGAAGAMVLVAGAAGAMVFVAGAAGAIVLVAGAAGAAGVVVVVVVVVAFVDAFPTVCGCIIITRMMMTITTMMPIIQYQVFLLIPSTPCWPHAMLPRERPRVWSG